MNMSVFQWENFFERYRKGISPVMKPIDYAVMKAVIRRNVSACLWSVSLFFKSESAGFSVMPSNDAFEKQKKDTVCFFQGLLCYLLAAELPAQNFEKCTCLSISNNCEFLLLPSINLPFLFLLLYLLCPTILQLAPLPSPLLTP